MAFGRSELRLILGVQAYGTSNLARLRRDITSLGRTVDLANANQSRVATQAAQQMEKTATLRNSIAQKESSIARKFSEAQAARTAGLARTDRTRARILGREQQLAAQAAAKRMQIANTEAAHAKGTTGSAALRNQVSRMGLENQTAKLADRRISLAEKELGLQRSIRTTRARAIDLEKQLTKLGASGEQIGRWRQANANLGSMGTRLKPVVLRLQAADINAAKLESELAGTAAESRILDGETLKLNASQQKVLATIDEQVAAMGRLDELVKVQNSQLAAIEAKEAAIAEELRVIQAEESRINGTHARRIAELQVEEDLLKVQKLELVEQDAVLQRMLGHEMARAAAMDRQAVRADRLAKREVLGRTVAHAGRTAQFGGLIGTAVLATAGNAAAELGRKTALAGTQMRDMGGTFLQSAQRGRQLQNVIMGMMETFPSDAQEMADSAYDIFSSMNLVHKGVVDVTEGYKLMAVANKMAVAGQVDLDEATSAMIVTLNNFDPNLQHVNETMNQVFSIVRFGQMRLSDFAAAMVPLAPIAKTVGLSLIDVGSALATLTILFKSPQQAAQGLARAIELLQLEPFQKGLKEAGVSVTDAAGRMRPLNKVVADMAKTFPEATTGQRSMVDLLTRISKTSGMTKAGIQGTVQARRALAGLITSMGLYKNILANIEGSQNEFNEAFRAMKDTPGVQWAIFINQMKAFALVIGQAALPYLLKLGDKLVAAAHWIENLIKSTNGAIIKWAVFGGAALLVGGTITNMLGSIIALSANMRILTMSMAGIEGAATKAGTASRLLAGSMAALMGIGIISIPIIIQLMRGGDPSLWMLLGSALAGAAGGAMIGGPPGAVLGALAVPLVVEVIAHYQKPDKRTGQQIAYDKYKEDLPFWGGFKWPWEKGKNEMMSFDEFKKKHPELDPKNFKIPKKIGEDVAQGMGSPRGPKKKPTWMQQYEDYMRAFTKDQLAAQNAWFDQMGQGEDKADTAARLAKARAKVISQAWENMQQKIDQAVDKLGGVYDKFLEQNKSTFGELGKGPVLSGFMGDIFRGINDLLMQFGQSVAIPPSLINRDLEVQMSNFDKIRKGYADLIAKGVPQEVVQQIQAMGMDALPFVQGLLQMSGPEFAKWKQRVEKSHQDMIKATDIDFDAQLKVWKKYGSDIATKIIDGLSSDAAKKVLSTGFRENVIELFGDTFKKEMAKEIAQGLKEIAEGEAARIAAEKKAKAAAEAAKKARGKPPLYGKHPGKVDPKTGEAADKVPDYTKDPRYVPGKGIITHPESDAAKAAAAARRRAGYASSDLNIGAGFPGARFVPGQKPGTVINNNGDAYTVHADGVHPTKVKQALNKKSFETRNKKR